MEWVLQQAHCRQLSGGNSESDDFNSFTKRGCLPKGTETVQVHACMFIEPTFLNICSKLGPALGLLGFENNEGRVHVFKELTVKLGDLS